MKCIFHDLDPGSRLGRWLTKTVCLYDNVRTRPFMYHVFVEIWPVYIYIYYVFAWWLTVSFFTSILTWRFISDTHRNTVPPADIYHFCLPILIVTCPAITRVAWIQIGVAQLSLYERYVCQVWLSIWNDFYRRRVKLLGIDLRARICTFTRDYSKKHCANNIVKNISFKRCFWIPFDISMKFAPKCLFSP